MTPSSPSFQSLPFIRDEPKGTGRNFWAVASTGDFSKDWRLGEEYALAFLGNVVSTNAESGGGACFSLGSIVEDMRDDCPENRGIRLGFMEVVCTYGATGFAIRGADVIKRKWAWYEEQETKRRAAKAAENSARVRKAWETRKRRALTAAPEFAVAAE